MDTIPQLRYARARIGFNGAMASQPWIPFDEALQVQARTMLQWSHGLPAMDTWVLSEDYAVRSAGFNGAMASQPWIHRVRRFRGSRLYCFNGAMASQPWIRPRTLRNRNRKSRLQWSHGLPAMDTIPRASNPTPKGMLQWSHGLPAMDTADFQDFPHNFCRLRPRFQVSTSVLLFDC